MIATRKKYKKNSSGVWDETTQNYHIGYSFTSNGIEYRMINENFYCDFDSQWFKFVFSFWMKDPINNIWGFVKQDNIVADTQTWRDAQNNLYFDLGDNTDPSNAFIYATENILDENDEIINTLRTKTIKEGLITEYDVFYNNILLGVCEPQISASIVYQNMNGITEIV
jgi:hypothetical protein